MHEENNNRTILNFPVGRPVYDKVRPLRVHVRRMTGVSMDENGVMGHPKLFGCQGAGHKQWERMGELLFGVWRHAFLALNPE